MAAEPYSTVEELNALTNPHPVYQKIIDQHGAGEYAPGLVDWMDPNVLVYLNKLRATALDGSYGVSPASVKEHQRKIPMRDGHESLIIVYTPATPPPGGSPLIQLNFGGGFVMGEARQLGGYARGLVQLFGATVVCITYRLGPQHPFPTGHYDAWDSFVWIGQHAAELGADPAAGFVVGGVSAGGNLSVVVAQNAVEQKTQPPITGLWLCVPAVFPSPEYVPEQYKHLFVAPYTKSIAEGPILSLKSIEGFRHHYNPDYESKWYTPVHADKPFEGLPKSYIEVNGMDPLRDHGLIYEKLVRKNGTETKLTVWPGLPHAHFATMQEPEADELRRAAAGDTMKGFAWLLGKTAPSDEDINKYVVLPASG